MSRGFLPHFADNDMFAAPTLPSLCDADKAASWAGRAVLGHGCEGTPMSAKTQVLITLSALSIVDIIIPVPIVGLILIYVVLQRPAWFTEMVRDIYGA